MKTQVKASMLLISLIFPAISMAYTSEQCVSKISALSYELDYGICAYGAALLVHRNGYRICVGLQGKLDGAQSKLESNKLVDKKIEDANEKLTSFHDTIYKLAFGSSNPTKKPNLILENEYYALYYLWLEASTCVNSLLL